MNTCLRGRSARVLLFALLFLSAIVLHAAETFTVVVQTGLEAKMRDGTILRADVYRPNAPGTFPVLLQRTPYDKRNERSFALKAASRGYVVVVQDVRGRYSSDGEWYPFKHESDDGYDTVEWVASLPYSNGKVGMFGGSYVGATQMLTAIAHPPHLSAICPVVTASNYHDGWTYQGGAFEQWFNESWTSGLSHDTFLHVVQKNTNPLNGIWKPLTKYPLFELPGNDSSQELTRTLAPYFLDWLAHPNYDEYWKRWSIEEHFPDIKVPMLTIAAWYDIFLGGSLRNYEGVKLHGGTEEARNGQRLLVMIGGHAGWGPKIGEVDFGKAANFDQDELTLQWYDHVLKGANNEFASSKRARIFVMGLNQWRDEDDWPLARAKETKYFLHSAGKANSVRGDGALTTSASRSETPDKFPYDPADPDPTIGGPLCCDPEH
ncbi:MAG TPA: CocE/NonD family hydrolase, partial [Terriglobales bacterium]|nr:CocE/NonD family hydrolase [Terriglobales bacterium]